MPHMLVGEIDGRHVALELSDGQLVAGRSPDSDLRIDHRSVSRRHATIAVDGERVTVTDLGSRNGTRVDGVRITGPTEAHDGSEIAFADVILRLSGRGARGAEEYRFDGTAVLSSVVSFAELRAPSDDRRTGSDLFRVLAEAGQFLVSGRPLPAVYDGVLDLVERAVPCDRVVLLSVEAQGSAPSVLASRVRGAGGRSSPLALSSTMVRRVIDDGASLLTGDAQVDPRFKGHESVVLHGTRAAMAAPLFDNRRIIGLLYADTTNPSSVYGEDELKAFTALANLIAIKITQARLAESEEEKRRLERELVAAREILGHILREDVRGAGGYEMCLFHEPCTEVGGDLYDVRHLDDGRTTILAGDVAGKGLGAAILVSSIVPMTQMLLESGCDLADAAAVLNRRIWASTDAERYATLFMAVLDRASGRLDYVNAGHTPPILISAAGTTREITATSMPIGMLEEAPFSAGSAELAPGSMLAVFSDGITEAAAADGSFYEKERLERLLVGARGLGPEAIVARVLDDVRSFTAGARQSDDILLLLLLRPPQEV